MWIYLKNIVRQNDDNKPRVYIDGIFTGVAIDRWDHLAIYFLRCCEFGQIEIDTSDFSRCCRAAAPTTDILSIENDRCSVQRERITSVDTDTDETEVGTVAYKRRVSAIRTSALFRARIDSFTRLTHHGIYKTV